MRLTDCDIARFWAKVQRAGPSACWEWRAATDSKGYGGFHLGTRATRKNLRAHRVAYELEVGPIPAGLDVDHRCRNRRCVNPAHLEPVTRCVNLRRGPGAVRACMRGHAYTPENTYVTRAGTRRCRECARVANRQWWRRQACHEAACGS